MANDFEVENLLDVDDQNFSHRGYTALQNNV